MKKVFFVFVAALAILLSLRLTAIAGPYCRNDGTNTLCGPNCLVDSDQDGIKDCRDDCLSTPARIKVDTSGCPVRRAKRVRDPLFKTQADQLVHIRTPWQPTVESALKDIFDLSHLPPETRCMDVEGILTVKSDFFERVYSATIPSMNGGLQVYISLRDDLPEHRARAQEGMDWLRLGLPKLESYLGPFPCGALYIVLTDQAAGAPGWLMISDEHGGINNYWLLYHELTHTYLNSGMSYSWFGEAAAGTLPTIIADDLAIEGLISPTTAYGAFPPEHQNLHDQITMDLLSEDWGIIKDLRDLGIESDARICDQENNYVNGSNLGRVLFLRIILNNGKQNLEKALKTIYVRYRITGKRAEYYDIFRAIRYFTPADQVPWVESSVRRSLCM